MAHYWILAADSSEARLFTREKKLSKPIERHDWLHPESRMPGSDLEHDRQGQTFSSQGHDQSDNQKQTDPKTREARDFARDVANYLDTARAKGEFKSLSIVADPSFLGLLREYLDSETRDLVDREVDKNLTRRSAETIAEAVDED
ncbi:MAG TPA: host attachment protein [Wenzhouxiangellaceae bacterium]|nr:host attachment protein [Wenzhouxiangellaceae bacterium]